MKARYILSVVIVLLSTAEIYGREYYVSNPLGMALREVSIYGKSSHPWILEIENTGAGEEIRTLYHNNSVYKKYVKKKSGQRTVISVWKDGIMVRQMEYLGRYMTKESVFKENGDVDVSEYIRDGDRLKSVSHLKNGVLKFRDIYITGLNGRLYQVRRVYSDGKTDLFGIRYSAGNIQSEWSVEGDRSSIYYFDNNVLRASEEYEDDKLVSYEEKSGNGEDVFTGRNMKKEETTVKKYDDKNRLVYEESFGKNSSSAVSYKYSGDLLKEKLVKTPGNRIRHVYAYDEGGSLLTEEVYVNGVLQKVIKPVDGGKMEETIYRNNIPILKVITEDGLEVSRETVSDGE